MNAKMTNNSSPKCPSREFQIPENVKIKISRRCNDIYIVYINVHNEASRLITRNCQLHICPRYINNDLICLNWSSQLNLRIKSSSSCLYKCSTHTFVIFCTFKRIIYLSWKIKYVDNGIIQFTPVFGKNRFVPTNDLSFIVSRYARYISILLKRCFRRSKNEDIVGVLNCEAVNDKKW